MNRAPQFCPPPGQVGTVAFVFGFLAWMRQRRTMPTANELVERYGMTKATAYRYLRRYRDAMGLEDPR